MSELIGYLGSFNTNVLVPFIVQFFESNVGFIFLSVCVLIVVLGAVVRLEELNNKWNKYVSIK